ncbi:hypothetical protein MRX96_042236 [Rhipicephalus microplus]
MLDGSTDTVVTASPLSHTARPNWSCPALLLPSGPAARQTRRHRSCPPELREGSSFQAAPRLCPFWLSGTTPCSATSERAPDSPAAGPSSPASTVSSSLGSAGSEAPASSRSTVPVQPRQLILDDDVLWVYIPAPAELQCPVGNCSMKYSGAVWTCHVPSVRRHVEFMHGVRVKDRIYVCSVCDSALTSRPSYHRCFATDLLVPSTETPPSDESWAQCEEAWMRAVALAVEAVRLPPVRPGRQRRQPDPSNAVDIQRLYHHNRRRPVRLILRGHVRRASFRFRICKSIGDARGRPARLTPLFCWEENRLRRE